jgi:DivIVA domain-containing protein
MKKKDRQAAQDFSGMPPAKAVTPADIQAKEFGVSRFGGYKMHDVDEFLDELTASVTKLTEENERLRAGGSAPPAPIGAPDLDDTARQADEIIERARAEAARIVRDAEDRAAAPSAAGQTGTGDRAAVAAFLTQEREFLQRLAALVQEHAETIKAMARSTRPLAASSAGPASAGPAVAPAAASGPAADAPTSTRPTPSGPQDADGPTPEADPDEPSSERPSEEEPIRVDEPTPASVAREADDEPPASPQEGDPSLRELFWGED